MRDRPEGVRENELIAVLLDGWGLDVRSISYLSVGAGSYHWAVTDDTGGAWFVTVDDLSREVNAREHAFSALARAFDTALALRREAGLEFVVAPVSCPRRSRR